MKFAIVAATALEIRPVKDFLRERLFLSGNGPQIFIFTTGVGMMDTTYRLASFLRRNQPDFMIQGGIGGSFTDSFYPGQVVMIGEEVLGDLGVDEKESFKDVFDLGLKDESELPFTNKRLLNPHIDDWKYLQLPVVNGITVNEITTSSTRINLLKRKYCCDIESMEGAAFHYVCLLEQVPFLQVRSVSNFVGERDKTKWKLKESIDNLNTQLIRIIQQAIIP